MVLHVSDRYNKILNIVNIYINICLFWNDIPKEWFENLEIMEVEITLRNSCFWRVILTSMISRFSKQHFGRAKKNIRTIMCSGNNTCQLLCRLVVAGYSVWTEFDGPRLTRTLHKNITCNYQIMYLSTYAYVEKLAQMRHHVNMY